MSPVHTPRWGEGARRVRGRIAVRPESLAGALPPWRARLAGQRGEARLLLGAERVV